MEATQDMNRYESIGLWGIFIFVSFIDISSLTLFDDSKEIMEW